MRSGSERPSGGYPSEYFQTNEAPIPRPATKPQDVAAHLPSVAWRTGEGRLGRSLEEAYRNLCATPDTPQTYEPPREANPGPSHSGLVERLVVDLGESARNAAIEKAAVCCAAAISPLLGLLAEAASVCLRLMEAVTTLNSGSGVAVGVPLWELPGSYNMGFKLRLFEDAPVGPRPRSSLTDAEPPSLLHSISFDISPILPHDLPLSIRGSHEVSETAEPTPAPEKRCGMAELLMMAAAHAETTGTSGGSWAFMIDIYLRRPISNAQLRQIREQIEYWQAEHERRR